MVFGADHHRHAGLGRGQPARATCARLEIHRCRPPVPRPSLEALRIMGQSAPRLRAREPKRRFIVGGRAVSRRLSVRSEIRQSRGEPRASCWSIGVAHPSGAPREADLAAQDTGPCSRTRQPETNGQGGDFGVSCHGSSSTLHRGAGQCSCAHSKKELSSGERDLPAAQAEDDPWSLRVVLADGVAVLRHTNICFHPVKGRARPLDSIRFKRCQTSS